MIKSGAMGWAAGLTALVIWGLVIVGPSSRAGAAADDAPTTDALVKLWDAEHISPPLPPLVTHQDVVEHVTKIVADTPDLFSQEVIGQSNEGRTLHHVWFGKGATHILLWSQMHGDEPTATSALFDVHNYVRLHRNEPIVRRMLETLTIHVVPMLNPDGAERYQRRNLQDIDINRDAVRLQTPEGRALKALRDRIEPVLGFNLHNQNWSTSVGFPPKPASISLLAVAFNRERTDNEKRMLAKKTSAIIREAIEPLMPGRIGRYDDEFEVRAFGDNIAKWGTGVVLIETGPAPGDDPDRTLIRANFVAIVTALDALASGRVKKADPKRYETLPFNESRLLHTLVTGATLVGNPKLAPYIADIGIAGTRVVRRVTGGSDHAGNSGGSGGSGDAAGGHAASAGKRTLGLSARIADLGDLQTLGALNAIDAKGLTAAPLWDENLKPGDEVGLPDWAAWKGPTIAIGQPPNIVLLAPLAASAVAATPAAPAASATPTAPTAPAAPAASTTPAASASSAAGAASRYRVERVIRFADPFPPDRK